MEHSYQSRCVFKFRLIGDALTVMQLRPIAPGSGVSFSVFINRDSLPLTHDAFATHESCNIFSCTAEASVNHTCDRISIAKEQLALYGSWYLAIRPNSDTNDIISYSIIAYVEYPPFTGDCLLSGDPQKPS